MTKFQELAPAIMGRLIDDFELTHEDVAAIVGNLAHECDGFDTLQEVKPLVPGSKGGYGWAQWTGPRRRAYEAWCKRKGYKGDEFEANYSFLFRELIGPEGRALPAVKRAVGLAEKTEVFMETFLRPGIPHLQSRIFYAKKAMQMQPETAAPAPVDVQAEPKTGVQKADEMLIVFLPKLVRLGMTLVAGGLVTKGLLAPGMESQLVEVGVGIGTGALGLGLSWLNGLATKAAKK
jgi:hypothetical protein